MLNGHPNILKCYGTFVRHDCTGRLTHNLFLEHAASDLSDYWENTTQPSGSGSILWAWKQIVGISHALQSIHQPKVNPLPGREIMGRHGDLKPDNILYFDGKFKVADLGFSHFKMVARGKTAKYHLDGQTYTYSE